MRLRVCQMITSLQPGGAERVVLEIARGLDLKRFDVTVAAVRGGGTFEETLRQERIPVSIFNVDGAHAPVEFARLVRFLHGRFEVVHAHPGSVARAAAFAARVPVVVSTQHSMYSWRGGAWRTLSRALARRTDRMVAVSGAVAADTCQDLGLPPLRVEVVYNGVDTGLFRPPTPAEREKARARLGLAPDVVALGIVGRLDTIKRCDRFVRALARAHAAGASVAGFALGAGPERADLEGLARSTRAPVTFLGQRADVADVLRGLDVLVHTTDREGFGLAVVEGIATGLPALVSDLPALREVIGDGVAGRLHPPGDVAALAAHMTELSLDEPLRTRLGAAGRERAERLFSLPRMVAAYAAIYEQEAARRGLAAGAAPRPPA